MNETRKALNNFNKDMTQFTESLQRHVEQLQVQVKANPAPLGHLAGNQIKCMKEEVGDIEAEISELQNLTTNTTSTEELLGHSVSVYNAMRDMRLKVTEYLQQYGYTPPEGFDAPFNADEYQAKENSYQNNQGFQRETEQDMYREEDASAMDSEFCDAVSTPTILKGRSSSGTSLRTPEAVSLSPPIIAELDQNYGRLSVQQQQQQQQDDTGIPSIQPISNIQNNAAKFDWSFTPVNMRAQLTPFPRSPIQFTPGTLPLTQPKFTAQKSVQQHQVLPTIENKTLQYISHGEYDTLQQLIKKYLSYEQLNKAITGLNQLLEDGQEFFSFQQLDEIVEGQHTKTTLNALLKLDRILMDLDDQNQYRILV